MRRISVLAVDDDEVDLEALRRTLADCDGYCVEFNGYRSWEKALDALADQAVDVIFLDFFLGNITGTRLLTELRDRGDLRPVIMLTGNGNEGTAKESIRLGASDYLSKSKLTPEILVRAIESAHREYKLRMENAYLEQELRASRHLEAIGTLAGGVAHDFNNFLAGILSSAELAQLHATNPVVRRELERIIGIVDGASKVIRQLLQFNKFYAGDGEIGAVDVHEVARSTFAILEHSRPKGIALNLDSDKSQPAHVIGSAAKMHQILLNLCVNAIEAMETEGNLHVSVRCIGGEEERAGDLIGLPPGPLVAIYIADTGPGIPEDIRARMFDPFFTTKAAGAKKGTGLGLATVWECVHTMGGTIRVRSELNQGTEFQVFLPASAASPPPAPVPSTPGASIRGSETILLVDDEAEIRVTTAELLRRLGYTVHCLGSGGEVIAALEQQAAKYDILVLDISMPGMDGRETLRRLRESGNTVPVLMATGHSAEAEGGLARQLGATGVIQKPFAVQRLAGCIRAALDTPQTREDPGA